MSIIQFLRTWLLDRRFSLSHTWEISKTGAEDDPCQMPGCGVQRKFHEYEALKHHFKENENA